MKYFALSILAIFIFSCKQSPVDREVELFSWNWGYQQECKGHFELLMEFTDCSRCQQNIKSQIASHIDSIQTYEYYEMKTILDIVGTNLLPCIRQAEQSNTCDSIIDEIKLSGLELRVYQKLYENI